jgi:erythrocyte band 7 integral membrane protein
MISVSPDNDVEAGLTKKGNEGPEPQNFAVGSTNKGPFRILVVLLSWLAFIITFPISIFSAIKIVQEYERIVIFRLGRLTKGGPKGPGVFLLNPIMDSLKKVDLRTMSFNVPPQEILSRDSVTLKVDAVIYFRVSDATMAITNIYDYKKATHLLAASILRNVLGTKAMTDILSSREEISHSMQSILDLATNNWGVKVERVEIKDVQLPVELQRSMAAEAEATREANAKVIAAKGEQNAALALKDASDVLVESPAAIQLRYLQTLTTISAEKNSTIVFPLPMDLLGSLMKK